VKHFHSGSSIVPHSELSHSLRSFSDTIGDELRELLGKSLRDDDKKLTSATPSPAY
jgi:hypothetical protein